VKKIDNIEIKNFKSIRHAEIKDCRRINVFIGYPNTGKSNILEALSLFSIDESHLDLSAFIRFENLTTLFFNGEISKKSEIRLNSKHRIVSQYQGNIVFQYQFEREGTSFEKLDSGNSFLDDSTDVLIKKSFSLSESNKNIFDYRFSPIGRENNLAEIKKYEFSKKIEYSTKNYFGLDYPFGNNIFSIISSNTNLHDEVMELFKPYNLELLYDSRIQEFTIQKRVQSRIFSIPYGLVADTLQRLIFYKAAIASNKDSILLFEEPEAHMFPPYISKFTGDIIFDKNNNQYFITTHSPFVLNDLMENMEKNDLSIYAVGYKKENGETSVRRLTSEEVNEVYQYGVDLFFNLEDYLKNAVS